MIRRTVSNRTPLFVAILAVVLCITTSLTLLACAQQQRDEIPVVHSTFRVDPAKVRYWPFKVATYYLDSRIAGNAMATGGSGNDIRVLVLTEQQFELWTRNPRSETLYDSGQRRSVVLSVPITDPGTYYVVFDNRFSVVSPKNVTADIRFVHRGINTERAEDVKKQISEREQRMTEITSKLIRSLRAAEKELGTHQIQTPIYLGIVDDPTPNAFAIWRKRQVAIHRGTFEIVEAMASRQAGDDVLAGVLAHELAHLFYRHAFGNDARQGQESVIAGSAAAYMVNPVVGVVVGLIALDRHRQYDRMQESEADILGVRLACASGYDPHGLLTFMERLRQSAPDGSFLRDHPSPNERVVYLRREIAKLRCAGVRQTETAR